MAARTSLRDLKKSARADDLSPPAAGWTINGARARRGAVAVAFIAGIEFTNFDFFFGPGSRFLERDLHIVTQIGTALPIFRSTAGAAKKTFENSTASTAATENFAENIERIMETAAAKSTATLRERSMSVTIVGGAFIVIDQHIVGFTDLLEFFFRMRVVWIFVGMEFDREFAIGALDIVRGRAARDFQHFVIIAFIGGGHF